MLSVKTFESQDLEDLEPECRVLRETTEQFRDYVTTSVWLYWSSARILRAVREDFTRTALHPVVLDISNIVSILPIRLSLEHACVNKTVPPESSGWSAINFQLTCMAHTTIHWHPSTYGIPERPYDVLIMSDRSMPKFATQGMGLLSRGGIVALNGTVCAADMQRMKNLIRNLQKVGFDLLGISEDYVYRATTKTAPWSALLRKVA